MRPSVACRGLVDTTCNAKMSSMGATAIIPDALKHQNEKQEVFDEPFYGMFVSLSF